MRDLFFSEIFSVFANILTVGKRLHKAPTLPIDEIRNWQLRRIKFLVAYAYDHVPFYRDLYKSISFHPKDFKDWSDFRKLPIVSKEQVIANYPERMLSAKYRKEELVISRSSGSGGKVLDIAYDQKAMTTFILAGLRLYNMCFSYRPWYTQMYVYTSPYPLDSLLGCYPLVFVSTLTPIEEILVALKKVNPELLVCYPSILKNVAQKISPPDLRKLKLKAISVNSEMSTFGEREEYAKKFGCPVFDEYSSEELTRIAAQCKKKTYHVFEDINYIEVLDSQNNSTDELGVIVGTNLHNTAMPMIRYLQNDFGKIRERECDCGWKFRSLENLEGRRNDCFKMPSGKILSSGFLLDATYEFLLAYRDAILDFCLIQESEKRIVLQAVPGLGWTQTIEAKISARFKEFLEPSVEFIIHCVEECEKTKTGKRNPIINKVSVQPSAVS